MLEVARPEYDLLLTHHPKWMREVWPTLDRAWHLTGVTVRGAGGTVLPAYLAAIRAS